MYAPFDTEGPTIIVSSPPVGFSTTLADVTIQGKIGNAIGIQSAEYSTDGANYSALTVNPDSTFSQLVPLRSTDTDIHIRATDRGGRVTEIVRTVLRTVPRVAIRILLQGPYDPSSGKMLTTLNSNGCLAQHFTGVTIPSDAVDSIALEIRNTPDAASAQVRKYAPAWLASDGSIRMFANSAKAYVDFDAPVGNYYVVIHHRNHIPVMSKQALSLGTSNSTFDFSDWSSGQQSYGTNPMKQLAAGVYGMFAGDANSSGDISILDRSIWRTQNSLTEYLGADFNLSGDVSILDRALWRQNNSITSQVP